MCYGYVLAGLDERFSVRACVGYEASLALRFGQHWLAECCMLLALETAVILMVVSGIMPVHDGVFDV